MRIAIREQLATLVILAVLVALAIVSIPTWVYVNKFVGDVESNGLALTASLKAARFTSEIELVQTNALTVATRILIQKAFLNFYGGQNDSSNWNDARTDLESAFSASNYQTLFQARLYSRNTTGNPSGLLNVTGRGVERIRLPYANPDGSPAILGDSEFGYPAMLYPNITFNDTGTLNPYNNRTNSFTASPFPDVRVSNNGGLLLGPMMINSSFALMSVTVPVRDNNNTGFILGYMTLLASASSLIQIMQSREGLGNTGIVLVVGPSTLWNRFNSATSSPPSNQTFEPPDKERFQNLDVRFVLPPQSVDGVGDRHSQHDIGVGGLGAPFKLNTYPTVLQDFIDKNDAVNLATSTLLTNNEQGHSVAVGVARPSATLVNWAVVVEQDSSEAYGPIVTLRKILLGCVFGTAGLVLLLIIPCAHLSVKPIRQLKDATEQSITPPWVEADDELPSSGTRSSRSRISDSGWFLKLRAMVGVPKKHKSSRELERERAFKIPGKVPEKKHVVTDELTELTSTFNAMTEELLKQYESLDEKVEARTRELELSKKAAEAANESKTLFIANISHELKTPLNGIMGMCAVCMEEDDVVRIKQSLKTLYKSGMASQIT